MLKSAPLQIVSGAGAEDVARLLLDAVRLARRVVAASRGPRGTDAAPALIGEKVRNEAAMLLRSAWPLRTSTPDLSAELDGLADDLATRDVGELGVRLCLHPGIAIDLALVPLHLRDISRSDPRVDALLDAILNDRLHGPERPANRQLEQLWLQSLWTGEVDSTAVDAVAHSSCLAWEFDHLSGTTDDAYAFTHAILYATDHGRRRIPLPRPVDQIVADADGILAVALAAENYDVAAEILWTWPMLHIPWSQLAVEAWHLLANIALTTGFLPGPGFDEAILDRLPAAEQDAYLLQTSYHTTLVHGMLLAAAVGPAAPALPAFLTSRQTHTDPATVTMALRRAVATADIAAIATIVRDADDSGLPATPALRQSRRLLATAAVCAKLAQVRRRAAAPNTEPA
ncbi:MAG: hypothetical protein IPJ61_05240 [Tessaracoccus sp.]|uniref:DUF6895 family protein n=1 Tax=Tessaracoccus sp. TaxID=1971211 RepID=UPI001EC8882F|nr:hypothetical protein [Tessaracoccus sp.]MBK7820481.1 hypothetical protein [Tessaracoccus sp.]